MKNWSNKKIFFLLAAFVALAANTLVRIGQIKATGTPSSSTWLRGDGTWTDMRAAFSVASNNWLSYNSSTGVFTLSQAYAALTDGATINWACSTGLNKTLTITGNHTLSITGMNSGDNGIIIVTEDGTGGWALTVTDGPVTITTTAGAVTILSWTYDGTHFHWTSPVTASGTVTSFSAGDLSPLFTTSEATISTTPALTFSLSTVGAHKWFGNNTGSSIAPDFYALVAADIPTLNQNTTGSAATLTTARNINGVSFNGSADITIPGTLLNIQYLTSGTTYTPTSGTNTAVLHLWGAGGGGGGVTGAASNAGAGGGGGSGGYLIKKITSVSGTYSYSLGTGGTAGANTGGTGGAGGNTTFTNGGTTYTAFGGSGGVGLTSGTTAALVAGGAGGVVSTNGDVNGGGAPGELAQRMSGTLAYSGNGGSSLVGGGGVGLTAAAAGNNATGFGAGGGGALTTSNTNRVGGTGSAGLIIVYEYR